MAEMLLEPIAPGARETFADCPLDRFDAKAVRILRDRRAHRPEAANNRLRRLRQIFQWCIETGIPGVEANPARDVPTLRPSRVGGFLRGAPKILSGSKGTIRLAARRVWRLPCCCIQVSGAPMSSSLVASMCAAICWCFASTRGVSAPRSPLNCLSCRSYGRSRCQLHGRSDVPHDRALQAVHSGGVRELVSPALQ